METRVVGAEERVGKAEEETALLKQEMPKYLEQKVAKAVEQYK